MAEVSASGIAPRDLAGYRALLEERFRSALGADLSVSPETPQGGLISVMALSLAELDEALVAASNSLSIPHASGRQLDDLGTLIGVERLDAVRSTVAVTLGGEAGSTVPAGSLARTAAGALFRLAAAAVIGGAGTVSASMEAVELGPVDAAAGALDEIVTLVAGWESITNASAAVPGRLAESDRDYRARLLALPGRVAVGGPTETLAAAVRAVPNVVCVRVEENDTAGPATVQGTAIPAHSVVCVVDGGADAAIAAAIARHKGLGVGTTGAVSSGGVHFDRAVRTRIKVAVTTTSGRGFPADGAVQLRDALVRYSAGDWSAGADDLFERGGFGIGESVDERRLYSPLNAVPGHRITALAVTDAGGSALPAVTPLAARYALAAADVQVTVNSA